MCRCVITGVLTASYPAGVVAVVASYLSRVSTVLKVSLSPPVTGLNVVCDGKGQAPLLGRPGWTAARLTHSHPLTLNQMSVSVVMRGACTVFPVNKGREEVEEEKELVCDGAGGEVVVYKETLRPLTPPVCSWLVCVSPCVYVCV